MRDGATEAQVRASRPGLSTWLSANAGSGKTRVLTNRVARLLLGGTPPDRILCLTYTKAAASEMQNRLFSRLGKWAMMPDDALRKKLAELGEEGPIPSQTLLGARRLFAGAIETPGGLRIQTIHSFCATLLRRFPLEADISPHFTEVEDRSAEMLRRDILDNMAQDGSYALLDGVARYDTDLSLNKLSAAVAKAGQGFRADWDLAQARAEYGLSASDDPQTVCEELFAPGVLPLIEKTAKLCVASTGKWDNRTGQKLLQVRSCDPQGWAALERSVLTAAGKVSSQLFNKPLKEGALADTLDDLMALFERVADLRPKRLAFEAVARDAALHAFGHDFNRRYAREKALRGWLDFDDLIQRASDLLSTKAAASWVLYRLDGGVDHILVDEAQDTSPQQWTVIERLAQEIVSGEGARDGLQRTIFVVGDKKQSIYSFQGADADEFDRRRVYFADRLKTSHAPLQEASLAYSFRSSPAILRAVDHTFDGRATSGFDADAGHIAFHDEMPGRVDLWPAVPKAEKPSDPPPWFAPEPFRSSESSEVVLARRIATFIRDIIARKEPIPHQIDKVWHVRPVTAGDVLILVRGRGPLFEAIIRECKQASLDIAGADRLKVMAELAVRDIASLLSFLALPEDDLSLAEALKSPLLGWDEAQLFDLAHHRPEKSYLWQALRDRQAEFPETFAILQDLLEQADFLRPFDLIEHLLTQHGGRKRLLARLGPEAEDGLDAFLDQALAYERSEVPSLTGFLEWMQTDDLEIKREAEGAGERIRVMTVHGAKGLEAPVVILPDCGVHRNEIKDTILSDEGGLVWKARAADMPERQTTIIDRMKEANAREKDRLLYVAMTRAETWLIVAAQGDLTKDGSDWHSQVQAGLESAGAQPQPFEGGEGLRLGHGNHAVLPWSEPSDAPAPIDEIEVEDYAFRPATPPVVAPPIPTPSALGGAKALAGDDGDEAEAAKQRGTALHHLLEILPDLPDESRRDVAPRLLAKIGIDPEDPQSQAWVNEALQTIAAHPDLFGPDAVAEVPVHAPAGHLPAMNGVVDRLLLRGDDLLAVDFKSNRVVPDSPDAVPEGLLRQMGAYQAMLESLFPGKTVRTALLWTRTATLMPLPHDLVTQALARAHLDPEGVAS